MELTIITRLKHATAVPSARTNRLLKLSVTARKTASTKYHSAIMPGCRAQADKAMVARE